MKKDVYTIDSMSIKLDIMRVDLVDNSDLDPDYIDSNSAKIKKLPYLFFQNF